MAAELGQLYLDIVSEPPDCFYNQQGGKYSVFMVKVQLRGDIAMDSALGRCQTVPLSVRLLYESQKVVDNQKILQIMNHPELDMRLRSGVVKVRINEVSKNHQNQKFRLKIGVADDSTSGPFPPVREALTSSIRVLSKRANKRRARAKAAPAAIAESAHIVTGRPRKRKVNPGVDELAQLQQWMVTAVSVLRNVEWIEVGYESRMVAPGETVVDKSRPIFRCPVCKSAQFVDSAGRHAETCKLGTLLSEVDTDPVPPRPTSRARTAAVPTAVAPPPPAVPASLPLSMPRQAGTSAAAAAAPLPWPTRPAGTDTTGSSMDRLLEAATAAPPPMRGLSALWGMGTESLGSLGPLLSSIGRRLSNDALTGEAGGGDGAGAGGGIPGHAPGAGAGAGAGAAAGGGGSALAVEELAVCGICTVKTERGFPAVDQSNKFVGFYNAKDVGGTPVFVFAPTTLPAGERDKLQKWLHQVQANDAGDAKVLMVGGSGGYSTLASLKSALLSSALWHASVATDAAAKKA